MNSKFEDISPKLKIHVPKMIKNVKNPFDLFYIFYPIHKLYRDVLIMFYLLECHNSFKISMTSLYMYFSLLKETHISFHTCRSTHSILIKNGLKAN